MFRGHTESSELNDQVKRVWESRNGILGMEKWLIENKSPLSLLDTARTPQPLPLLASLLTSKAVHSAARDLYYCWRSSRFVCSRARREISTINGQQHCWQLQYRSTLPSQGWQFGAGRQVEGSWGRLGVSPVPELSFRQAWVFPLVGWVSVGLRG